MWRELDCELLVFAWFYRSDSKNIIATNIIILVIKKLVAIKYSLYSLMFWCQLLK